MKEIDKDGIVKPYWPEELGMTSLMGDMDVSYKDIVFVFGREHSTGDGYKVQAEWMIKTPAGWATIYDYKQGVAYNGRHDGIPKTKVRDWHIGGANKDVVAFIHKAMNVK